MSAPAVYAERRGSGWRLEHADESGYEGVACVDDAARLAILLLRAHERHGLPWALEWARLNLSFLAHLQRPNGSFANFILGWDGSPNLTGPTSMPGGLPWLGRALWALAVAHRVTGEAEYRERYLAGVAAAPRESRYADVAALLALSALELPPKVRDAALLSKVEGWMECILACERDGALLNNLGEAQPHLWGYIQPGVLCMGAMALGRPEWVEPARLSAERYLTPEVAREFECHRTMPYDVSSAIFDLDALALATGEAQYTELAALARAWFHGRNPAAAPVYHRELGMVFDGVDGSRVSLNSGAESNIEGGLALLEELPWGGYRLY
jgi:hypothetical protein